MWSGIGNTPPWKKEHKQLCNKQPWQNWKFNSGVLLWISSSNPNQTQTHWNFQTIMLFTGDLDMWSGIGNTPPSKKEHKQLCITSNHDRIGNSKVEFCCEFQALTLTKLRLIEISKQLGGALMRLHHDMHALVHTKYLTSHYRHSNTISDRFISWNIHFSANCDKALKMLHHKLTYETIFSHTLSNCTNKW